MFIELVPPCCLNSKQIIKVSCKLREEFCRDFIPYSWKLSSFNQVLTVSSLARENFPCQQLCL